MEESRLKELEAEVTLLRQAIKDDDPLQNVRVYHQGDDRKILGKDSIVCVLVKEISELKKENEKLKKGPNYNSKAGDEEIRKAAYEGKDVNLFGAKQEIKNVIGGLQIDLGRAWGRLADSANEYEAAEQSLQKRVSLLEKGALDHWQKTFELCKHIDVMNEFVEYVKKNDHDLLFVEWFKKIQLSNERVKIHRADSDFMMKAVDHDVV